MGMDKGIMETLLGLWLSDPNFTVGLISLCLRNLESGEIYEY